MNSVRITGIAALLSCLAFGCAEGPYPDSMSRDEVGAVSENCAALLARVDEGSAQPLALGQVSGSSEALLDTTDGRCRGSIRLLRVALRRPVASRIAGATSKAPKADPVPHPDTNTPFGTSTNNGPSDADPSPHPDKPDPTPEDSASMPHPSVDPGDDMVRLVWESLESEMPTDDDSSGTGTRVGGHTTQTQH